MFKNAYTYNEVRPNHKYVYIYVYMFPLFLIFLFQVDTQIYNDARSLEKFFNELLEKWVPNYAYWYEEDAVQPSNRKYRRIIND